MNNKLILASYALAVVSGMCFFGGIAILSNEGGEHIWTASKTYFSHWIER